MSNTADLLLGDRHPRMFIVTWEFATPFITNGSCYKVAASETLAAGPAVIRVDFKYDGSGLGKGGTVTLYVNEKKVCEGRVDKTVYARFGNETFDVGMDEGSPVSEAYQPPFTYTGNIKKVEINIQPSNLSANDQQKIREAELEAAMTIE